MSARRGRRLTIAPLAGGLARSRGQSGADAGRGVGGQRAAVGGVSEESGGALCEQRARRQLSKEVAWAAAMTGRPKPVHAVTPSPASPIRSKFWATPDDDDSEDDDEAPTPPPFTGSSATSSPSTEEFVNEASAAGFSRAQLVMAEQQLQAGKNGDQRLPEVILSTLLRRKLVGPPWRGPLPAERVSPPRTLGDCLASASRCPRRRRRDGRRCGVPRSSSSPEAGTVGSKFVIPKSLGVSNDSDQLLRQGSRLDFPPLCGAHSSVSTAIASAGGEVRRPAPSASQSDRIRLGPGKWFRPTKGLISLFARSGLKPRSRKLQPPSRPTATISYAAVVRRGKAMAAHGGRGFGGQGGGRGWGFAQGFHPGFDGGRGRGRDQRGRPHGHNGGGFGGGYGGGYGGGGYGGNSHGGYGGNRNRRGWQGGRRFAPAAGHAAGQFHAGGGVPGHQAGGQAVVGQLQQQAAAGQFQPAGFQTAGLADQQPAQAPFQAPLAGQQPTQPAAAGNQTREAGAVLFQQVSQSQKAQVAAPANGGGLGTSQVGTSALLASSQAAPAAAPAGSTRGAIIGGSAQDPAATHLEGFMATKPEPAQAGKQKSKGKPYCFRCYTKGHTLDDCTVLLCCDLCFENHVLKNCPNVKKTNAIAAPCGYAVEGMGFYYIPMNDNPKSNVEEHTVLVRVLDGSFTVDQLTVELDRLLPAKITWEIGLKGSDAFIITNFPSELREYAVNWGPMDTKTIKGKIRFEKGVENDVNRYEIDKVWVQFRGLPSELREFPIIWAIGSILGVSKAVDMRFTKTFGRSRLKVAVLDPNRIPDYVDVVIGDFVYELQFRMEIDMPVGEPSVIDMDSTTDNDGDNDGKGEDPMEEDANKNNGTPDDLPKDAAPENAPADQLPKHGAGAETGKLKEKTVAKSDPGKNKRPVAVLSQGISLEGSIQWQANMLGNHGSSSKPVVHKGETVSPLRSSKRNVSSLEQDSMEKATKLKARKNLDSTAAKGNKPLPSSFHNLDDSVILATTDSLGINLGDDVSSVLDSVHSLKQIELQRFNDFCSSSKEEKRSCEENSSVCSEDNVDIDALNTICSEIAESLGDGGYDPLCLHTPLSQIKRRQPKGKQNKNKSERSKT